MFINKKLKKRYFLYCIVVSLIGYVSFVYHVNKEHYTLPSPNLTIQDNVKNPSGIGVYYINLDRSTERRANVEKQLNGINLPIHRISGVDGNLLTQEEISKVFDAKAFRANTVELPTKGVIGCYMSHLKALQTFLNSNYEYALIFEDDIKISDINKLRNTVVELTKHKNLFDRVALGVNFYNGFAQPFVKKEVKKINDDVSLYQYIMPAFSMQSVLINRKAATILLQHAIPMKISAEVYADALFNDKLSNLYTTKLVRRHNYKSDITSSEKLSHHLERGDIITNKIQKNKFFDGRVGKLRLSPLIYYTKVIFKTRRDSLNNLKKLKTIMKNNN